MQAPQAGPASVTSWEAGSFGGDRGGATENLLAFFRSRGFSGRVRDWDRNDWKNKGEFKIELFD